MGCSQSPTGIGLKLDSRQRRREQQQLRLERGSLQGPRELGEGFGFYSRHIWQPLASFKGHTLFNCLRRDDSGCSVWSGFREASVELGTTDGRSLWKFRQDKMLRRGWHFRMTDYTWGQWVVSKSNWAQSVRTIMKRVAFSVGCVEGFFSVV